MKSSSAVHPDLIELPCGDYYTESVLGKPSKFWFYKPQWFWDGWRTFVPFHLGGDEWCRRTLCIGWYITGQVIIPFRACPGGDGCGGMVNGGAYIVDGRNIYLDDPYINLDD